MFDGINGWWWLVVMGVLVGGKYLLDLLLGEVSVRYFRLDKAADWILKDGWNFTKKWLRRLINMWWYSVNYRVILSMMFGFPLFFITMAVSVAIVGGVSFGYFILSGLLATCLTVIFNPIYWSFLLLPLRIDNVPEQLQTFDNFEIWREIRKGIYDRVDQMTFLPMKVLKLLRLKDKIQEINLKMVNNLPVEQSKFLLDNSIKNSGNKWFLWPINNSMQNIILDDKILAKRSNYYSQINVLYFVDLKRFDVCGNGCYSSLKKKIDGYLAGEKWDRVVFCGNDRIEKIMFNILEILDCKEVIFQGLKKITIEESIQLIEMSCQKIVFEGISQIDDDVIRLISAFNKKIFYLKESSENIFQWNSENNLIDCQSDVEMIEIDKKMLAIK